jgi:hypothetical protein
LADVTETARFDQIARALETLSQSSTPVTAQDTTVTSRLERIANAFEAASVPNAAWPTLTNIQDNELLAYSAELGVFINKSASGVAAGDIRLRDLLDVIDSTDASTIGQVLFADGTGWVNSYLSLPYLADVNSLISPPVAPTYPPEVVATAIVWDSGSSSWDAKGIYINQLQGFHVRSTGSIGFSQVFAPVAPGAPGSDLEFDLSLVPMNLYAQADTDLPFPPSYPTINDFLVYQTTGSGDRWTNITPAALAALLDHGTLSGLGDPADHTWAFLVDGSRDMTGDLLPNADGTLDIGATTDRWQDLFLSGDLKDSGGAVVYVRRDGTLALTGDWDAGNFEIEAQEFSSSETTAIEQLDFDRTATDANDFVPITPMASFVDNLTASGGFGLVRGGSISLDITHSGAFIQPAGVRLVYTPAEVASSAGFLTQVLSNNSNDPVSICGALNWGTGSHQNPAVVAAAIQGIATSNKNGEVIHGCYSQGTHTGSGSGSRAYGYKGFGNFSGTGTASHGPQGIGVWGFCATGGTNKLHTGLLGTSQTGVWNANTFGIFTELNSVHGGGIYHFLISASSTSYGGLTATTHIPAAAASAGSVYIQKYLEVDDTIYGDATGTAIEVLGDIIINADSKKLAMGAAGVADSYLQWDGSILDIFANGDIDLQPTSDVLLSGDNKKLALGAAGIVDSYFQWTGTILEAYSAGGLYRLTPAADTDIILTFVGTTNSGIIKWMEDEDYFEIQDDVIFSSDSGLAHGEIYAYEVGTTIAIAAAGVANKVQVTAFTTDGSAINTTPAHGSDDITVGIAGKYLVTVSMSISSTGGSAYTLSAGVWTNNGATQFQNVHMSRRLSGGGSDTGPTSMSGICDFAASDTVELWVWNETNTNDVIIDDVTLSVVQIAGT